MNASTTGEGNARLCTSRAFDSATAINGGIKGHIPAYISDARRIRRCRARAASITSSPTVSRWPFFPSRGIA